MEEQKDDYFISDDEQQRIEALDYTLPSHLRQILKGFKWAVKNKNTSAVILFDGRSGMGKTTLACQCGLYCDPNFTLDKVYFTPDQLLAGLDTAQPGSFHLLDEAMIISNRSSMSLLNRAIIQAMSMIRSKRIIVGFCINSIFDMDRNIVLSRADILLHVYGDSLTDRGKFMAFFKGADGIDKLKLLYLIGKKFYDYSKPKSNFNTTFSSRFIFNDEEYEKKKQQGISTFLNKTESKTTHGVRTARDNLIRLVYEKLGLTHKEIAKYALVSRNEVTIILNKPQKSGWSAENGGN